MEPKRKPVYEHDSGQPIGDDQYDGMEDMLGDDITETDWDPNTEDPPHDAWAERVLAEAPQEEEE